MAKKIPTPEYFRDGEGTLFFAELSDPTAGTFKQNSANQGQNQHHHRLEPGFGLSQ